jgi:ATP-dependent helicase HrpB
LTSLPIDILKPDFLNVLGSPATPIVVEAPTGSGKSTRLPLWMEEGLSGPVLVVEPRRVACRSLAGWLSSQRGEQVGQSIGYHVRFDVQKSPDTRILFATPGIVLRLLQNPERWPFAGILLDEFHERSWELDLIVTILRERRARAALQGPLVLTSATLEAASLVKTLNARHLLSEGRTYPVELEEEEGTAPPTRQNLDERLVTAVKKGLQQPGELLIFLPGVGEIESAKQALSSLARAASAHLVPVHGRLPLDKLAKALQPAPGQRRIFLSTNVAETSVTLPGVRVVIDSGLVRRRIHRAGRSVLALVPVSQAEARQRSGRAGRVAPGRCLRLWGRQASLQEVTPAEMERIELDELALAAAACGLPLLTSLPWLVPPPEFAWERAIQRLQQWKALDSNAALTPLGRRFFSLPLSVEEARFVVNAPDALAGTLADLCALLQLRRPLLRSVHSLPKASQDDVKDERANLLQGFRDEVMLSLQLLRFGDARLHGLDAQVLSEARRLSKALRQALQLSHKDTTPLPTRQELTDFLLQRVPEQVFVLRKRAQQPQKKKRSTSTHQPWANHQGVELSVTPYSLPYDSRETPPSPRAGLLFSHQWLSGQGLRVRGIGRFLLPCSPQQLAEAGLGDVEVATPVARKVSGEWQISGQVRRVMAGVTLRTEEELLTGRELREAFVLLTMQGQCWTEVREQLLDTLHLTRLLQQWPEPRDWTTPKEWRQGLPSLEEWLLQRLEELGVESSDDLALLELEDLQWPLLTKVDIAPWDLEALVKDFPRLWEYQGQRYQCLVEPRKRRVIMEPQNEQARKAKQPPAARLLPRFRGLAVDYRKASREFRWRQ